MPDNNREDAEKIVVNRKESREENGKEIKRVERKRIERK